MRRRTLLSTSSGIDIDPTAGRGTIGNYEFVDLGLPSGLLWATYNVGANIESDYGDYYMYGKGSRVYTYDDSMYKGMENPLASTADTATVVMGEGWRMPTRAEIEELEIYTTYSYTIINGVRGGVFISKTNPKAYVFFPFAGGYDGDGRLEYVMNDSYIWSSTPYDTYAAYGLSFYESGRYGYYRERGFSVRGVHAAV